MENHNYDVFISYSRKDAEIADKICHALEVNGITYFIDRQGIGGGMEFPKVISQAIKNSKVFLFLASKNSYESKFTQSEIVFAFNKKQKQDIIPFIIDGSKLPEELEFTFSAINWRRIEEHPINTVLVDDILSRIGKQRLINDSRASENTDDSNQIIKKGISSFNFTNYLLSGKGVAISFLVFSLLLFLTSLILNVTGKLNHGGYSWLAIILAL